MPEIFCPWEPSTYFFFSSNVPLLVHYSHGIAIFAALAIGSLIYISNPKDVISKLFLLVAGLFSIWAILDVILWATNDPGVVMFSWALQVLIEPITYVIAFYLFYIFVHRKLPPFFITLLISVALLPLILFLPTKKT